MKKTIIILSAVFALCMTSCQEQWTEHFGQEDVLTAEGVELSNLYADEYLQSEGSLQTMKALYQESGLLDKMAKGAYCTLIVSEDAYLADAEELTSHENFAKNLFSTMPVPPSSLTEGFGIYTLSGKNLWVTKGAEGQTYLNRVEVDKMVKVRNGYIYFVKGALPVQASIYEYIQSLGKDYSMFKQLIAHFEEVYFDAAASTPCGTDLMGNTIYSDSVMAIRNTLMDRYTEDGLSYWNMHSEAYQSTLFIPSNDLIQNAFNEAIVNIPEWLNRSATAADTLKFAKWMVSSFFVDKRLDPEQVAASVPGQFECVGGHIREINEATDKEMFTAYTAAQWKPSVQTVNEAEPVELSNGTAYFLTSYKIPNHIVIWRVKSRFYQIWAALNAEQRGWDDATSQATEGGYFRWDGWEKPDNSVEGQSAFELSSTLPTMYYYLLTAAPSAKAQADSALVSVEYDGLLYNDAERAFGLKEVNLPAGEYYLRMGFKHSLPYSVSIYFCGQDEYFGPQNCLVKDMSLIATGSNFHFDRGGAMEGLDFFGSESIGYPEYFDWRWWYDQDPARYQKASAYDTDGYQVAIVNLKRPGNFKIKVTSADNAALYKNGRQDRSKSDVNQLMMYHWCLRPTQNNY